MLVLAYFQHRRDKEIFDDTMLEKITKQRKR